MSVEKVDTLVVGAGQAGVAMSEHLSKCGVPHLVLERGRIAERWRSERWDSLVANGPAWHDRFPGMEFPGAHPDAFVAKEKVADYFVDYAGMIKAPIRSGQSVFHPHGDVIVLGSVASGSEIVAGGSIHVYGTLRGRAIAGSEGNVSARIFCRKNEAELLAVDGWYTTAEEMEGVSRGKAVQAFLDNDALCVVPLG